MVTPYRSNSNGTVNGRYSIINFIFTVVCNNGDIRLVGGTNVREGRVEVCDSQAWGTVCDDFWGSADAGVACVQLGYQRTGIVILSLVFDAYYANNYYRSNCVQ